VRGLLLLFVATVALAQPPKTIFPSDGKDPKQSGGAALLEAVCPGRVIVGKEIGCRGNCPEFTAFPGENFEWSLSAITRGHFLSAQSDDAVLSMTGCEPHSENFGGTALLTRHSQEWTMLWYKGGVETSACHKVKLKDLREILVCLTGGGGQGYLTTQLYIEDLRDPSLAGMAGDTSAFFSLVDNTGTCGWRSVDESKPEPLQYAYIEKVDFKTINGDVARISVTAHLGRRGMTLKDVDACTNELNSNKPHQGLSFLPPTKRYRTDFIFEGDAYRRSSGPK
jgi:hypothetical protein